MGRRLQVIILAAAAILVAASCGKPAVTGDASAASSVDVPSEPGMTSETATASESSSIDEPPVTEPAQTETTDVAPTDPDMPGSDDPADTYETYVYFVVETRTGFRLAREVRDLPMEPDPLVAAVEAMIQGPADPDYVSSWNPTTKVLGVEAEPDGAEGRIGRITVNLSAEANTANVGTAGAAMMLPQLVWTLSAASGFLEGDVTLQIDGQEVSEMWGAVAWDGAIPIDVETPEQVRLLVQLDHPRPGDSVTSPVEVFGDAAAFEATVLWRVVDSAGAEVDSGFTMTGEGSAFSPFSFTVDLAPGEYTVEIIEDDASGGEGGPPMVDTRSFTVIG